MEFSGDIELGKGSFMESRERRRNVRSLVERVFLKSEVNASTFDLIV